MRRKKAQKCASNFEKFLPLLGIDPKTFSTAKTVQFTPSPSSETAATLVCAKHAVAGLGMLTDHGLKDHGWLPSSEHSVQNTAKGPLLYQFRNYVSSIIVVRWIPVLADEERDNTHFFIFFLLSLA
jgi:hypothetical protein